MVDQFPFLQRLAHDFTGLLAGGLIREGVGVLLSVAYVIGVILAGWAAYRLFAVPTWLVRRLIIALTGFWTWIAFYWIGFWPAGWMPPILLLFLNYQVREKRWLNALALEDERTVNDIAGPQLPILILMMFLWWPGDQFMVITGVMAATVGESAATIVGRVWGKHRFHGNRSQKKTFEGSMAMLIVTFSMVLLVNFMFARIPDVWFVAWAVIGALLCSVLATSLEFALKPPIARYLVPILTGYAAYYYTVAGFR